jgi:hypothetical protein
MVVLMVFFILYVQENGMYSAWDLGEAIFGSFLSMLASVTLS